MRFAAALSEHPVAAAATGEVIGDVAERVGKRPDVAALFVTADHVGALEDMAAAVQTVLDPHAFIGATAGAVLAADRGVEDRPGVVLWAGTLHRPARPVHVTADVEADGWHFEGLDGEDIAGAGSLVLVADPFTMPADELVVQLREVDPALPLIGGLASAARGPGGNRLVIGGRVTPHGAVGLLLDPLDAPRTVVSQGCRPIGHPYTVTRSERNMVHELGGRPALERLMEMVGALEPVDRALAAQGVLCGIVADDQALEPDRGDFLVRGLVGADRSTGAVAVAGAVPVGAVVQFQVRDAATAGEDLEALLDDHESSGALVFTCNGRGAQMFGDAHHDAVIVHRRLGGAVAGMFCAGELGPVGGHNAVHGFTASIALFGP